MNIGTLDFEIIGKNDGIKRSLEEAKDSIKNFTEAAKDGGVNAGDAMQAAAAKIEQAWGQLESVGNANREALKGLEAEYTQVGKDAAAAFGKATAAGDKEYRTLTARQNALGKEIRQRKDILNQVEQLTDELGKEEQAFNKLAAETKKNESRTTSFKAQLRQLTQEMAMQEAAARQTGGETAVYALRATDAFKQMQIQAAQLTDAMADAQAQAKILSHDNAGLQGVISAVSGVAGAFSVAQGAMGLFAGENEELNKIMVKVQSIMAITVGLQQVANVLNKDSAASLTIFNKVREAFVLEMQRGNAELEKETINEGKNAASKKANAVATETQAAAERATAAGTGAATTAKKGEAAANIADTKGKIANTAATGASTVATKLFTRANIMLAASFKAVGVAIKSIPVIGWILAGVGALGALIGKLISKSKEAKKEQEAYYKAVAEGAAEPVAKIENLSKQWVKLGDNLEAKKKFVDENRTAFEELGVKITNVDDAERALNAGKQAFVNSQIAKAKALAATQKAAEYYKEALNASLKMEAASYGSKDYDDAREEYEENERKARKMIDESIKQEEEAIKALDNAGIESAKKLKEGSIAALEKVIEEKRAKLKDIADPKEYAATMKEIEKTQKQIDRITGAKSTSGTGKDPFKEKLDKQKKQYQEYAKWRNSTDEILQQAAATQFQALLKQGNTYLDYLKRERDKLMSEMNGNGTKKQRQQLATLNNAIADETKSTVLEQFDQELQRQLNGANSLIEKLAIIERKRKELANDGSELDQAEAELLQKQKEQLANEIESQYREAQQNYYDYLESKLTAFEKYQKDMAVLEEQYENANDAEQRQLIAKQMGARTQQFQLSQQQQYDQLTAKYAAFEEKKTALAKEWGEKRKVIEERIANIEIELQEAVAEGDEKRIANLTKERERAQQALVGIERDWKAALKELATEYLNNDIVNRFLESAEGSTVQKIEQLIKKLKERSADLKIPVEVDDTELQELIEKLEKLKKEAKGSESSVKKLAAAIATGDWGEAIEAAMDVVSEYGQAVSDIYGQVVSSMKELGIAGDETTQKILDDVGGVIQGTADLAAGIASGNYLQAISGGINLVTSTIKLWDDANRENADTIKAAEEEVAKLELAIKKLQNTLARTYNDERYDVQRQIIEKLQEELAAERRKLEAMRRDIDGSSSDYTEDDYRAQLQHIADIEEQITQAYEALAEDLTQTTIPDIENEITDALINAFANGYSNADIDREIAKIANKLMKQAAIEMLKTKYLADAVSEWYKAFENAMADGMLDEQEKSNLEADFANATAAFRAQLEALNSMFPDEEDVSGTLSGALKGASQESIDLLAGYTNATRIIEQNQLDILTRQLAHIASIDARLEQAVNILTTISHRTGISIMETPNADQEHNRAFGLTNDDYTL